MRHPNTDPKLDYIRRLYAPEDALLREMRETLAARDLHIHIGAEEGRLLQLLIQLHQPKTIIEIGTLAGYSSLWMARALPEGGHLHTIERNAAHAQLARGFFAQSEIENCITLHEGSAQVLLADLAAQGPFDMVFIDAEKLCYLEFLDWADAHVRPGGLIVADNTLLFDAVYQENCPDYVRPTTWNVMRDFNQRLANAEHYDALLLPTFEGLTIAIKR